MANRIDWDGLIKYRMSPTGAYKPIILKNASVNGAMLWLKEEIAVGSLLDVLMESKDDSDPVSMRMRVVRIEEAQYKDYTGYGCKLEMAVTGLA